MEMDYLGWRAFLLAPWSAWLSALEGSTWCSPLRRLIVKKLNILLLKSCQGQLIHCIVKIKYEGASALTRFDLVWLQPWTVSQCLTLTTRFDSVWLRLHKLCLAEVFMPDVTDVETIEEARPLSYIPDGCFGRLAKIVMLSEENEKAILLSKSIETMKKYKISEDAYSVTWSSQNIGQVETVHEKRKRALQFSKLGLVVPPSDQPFKSGVSSLCEIEPNFGLIQPRQGLDKNYFLQPVMEEREVITDIPTSSFGIFQRFSL
ncbi:hypothetical protein TEA_003933 [Camellia sinensis var. sinensis]|uniref:DUF4283 domain-containing protein n=1 Tax=Camellia sinensis var. sinensis TaxID=542762 RepID=A0A4S4E107_CAMSN|nr:hypothetical protein TEA_003933 [Camellia sinensis var. sinensis]